MATINSLALAAQNRRKEETQVQTGGPRTLEDYEALRRNLPAYRAQPSQADYEAYRRNLPAYPSKKERFNLPSMPVFWNNLRETKMVKRYQQDQGTTNYCGAYAISTALNMLYGTNMSGADVINALTQQPLWIRWPGYSWQLDGSAVLPFQQAAIVNHLGGMIVGQSQTPPRAEVRSLDLSDMVEILKNPNQLALFTYNTEKGNIFSGHVVVLAAYHPTRGFGFLNSGYGRDTDRLTWYKPEKIRSYLDDPIGLWNPNFVVISKP